MLVTGLAANVPERRLSNQDVVEIMKQKSQKGFDGNLDETMAKVLETLERQGSSYRNWFESEESWYPLIKKSIDRALAQANCSPDEIDLVIYSSIYRRLLEPGMSTIICKTYGFKNAECFDLIEACAGWLRACFVSQKFLLQGVYKKILVINLEAGVHEGEYGHSTFKIEKSDDLQWAFPCLTLGEAASATVLSHEGPQWNFEWRSYPEYADLCTLVLPDASPAGNRLEDWDIGQHGSKKFSCFSEKMQRAGFKKLVDFFIECKPMWQSSDLLIPHTTTGIDSFKRLIKFANCDSDAHSIFAKHGNVASCSFPTTINDAIMAGSLKSDGSPFLFMPAAGFSYGATIAHLALG